MVWGGNPNAESGGLSEKKMADIRGYVQTEAPFQRGCVARLDAEYPGIIRHATLGGRIAGTDGGGTGSRGHRGSLAMAHSSANEAG